MMKLLFCQDFSRKKTKLLLLFMIKISQNITKYHKSPAKAESNAKLEVEN